ncbi:hypothetical protein [Crateriforma conspicua]|uniref:Uncharacterized protein n=1 Tax=Crateriforma conspicua TaxID=2527996 RepID=A0A5C6FGP5_9PLAN|nr:hypothetical protein [Crateriforma conspicua]QDV61045.1 hypothetical protein Mal65_01680 [Crateriforma conspicua]TWU60911.1 hypothetical protein V7x_52190 [Crateriforma conspicua]
MPRALLTIAIVLLLFMLLFQLYRMQGTGTFHADYYYLPLREYVDADRQYEMEAMVIERYNAASRRSASISLVALGTVLLCVTLAYRGLPSPVTDSKPGGEPSDGHGAADSAFPDG